MQYFMQYDDVTDLKLCTSKHEYSELGLSQGEGRFAEGFFVALLSSQKQ